MTGASQQETLSKIKKYWDYLLDHKSFNPQPVSRQITDHALAVAKEIRGDTRQPAIIIQGIMKRSGTVYVGELLLRHPGVSYYPNSIWEIPFLAQTDKILAMQQDFFFEFKQNRDRVGEHDFLPLFGSAFLAYLFKYIPKDQRMLLKIPGVQYLHDFYHFFPFENLLLLTRDGRDVVSSTIKTWPQIRFVDACRRWNRSAKMVLAFRKLHAEKKGFICSRFEDAFHDPTSFIKQLCQVFDLDPDLYPYDELENIPVIGSSSDVRENGGWRFKRKSANFQPVGRWKVWSKFQKWQFKRIAGQSLIDLGYSQDYGW